MPPLVLPGYDFDPVKNRYFKLAPGQSPRSTTSTPAEPSRPLPRKKRKLTHDLFLPASLESSTPSCASCPCSHTALIHRGRTKEAIALSHAKPKTSYPDLPLSETISSLALSTDRLRLGGSNGSVLHARMGELETRQTSPWIAEHMMRDGVNSLQAEGESFV